MIFAYGVTLKGGYHNKDNTPCQDAHKIKKVSDDYCIAAVADGLGSESHSDTASKIAVEKSVEYCEKNITPTMTDEEIQELIRSSFHAAQDSIEDTARNNHHDIDQYDATLSLAVLIGGKLHYGHIGDSGIIALNEDGLYEKITEQHRDDYGRVYPLYFRKNWIFGSYDKTVASVFLATDGIYDTLFPVYLKFEPIQIYVALAQYFMDNTLLKIDQEGEDKVQQRITDFLSDIPVDQVDDDKTVVTLINSSIKPKLQPPDYYQKPDWEKQKQKWEEKWKAMVYQQAKSNNDNSSNNILPIQTTKADLSQQNAEKLKETINQEEGVTNQNQKKSEDENKEEKWI